MTALRIIFMGTPDFAVESLKRIHESGRAIVGVITSPDRKAGRGQKLQQSAVKKYALKVGLPVLQPTNLKDESFLGQLRDLKADLQVVVAFRMLPEVVWNMPPLGTFNLHASLLPQYRGAAPINWAIINGEKKTGLTTFFLKHQIDTGDLLFQKEVPIAARETAGSLHDKLMKEGGELIIKSLQTIESGDYKLIPQSEVIKGNEERVEAPKIFREDCEIDWTRSAVETDRFIRGLSPYPTAWTKIQGRSKGNKLNLKIYEVSLTEQRSSVGEIKEEGKQLFIGTADYFLEIHSLQLEGKKRMTSTELLNGFSFKEYQTIRL